MTGAAPDPRPGGARLMYLAPFGRHTRYMLSAYLRHVLMVAAALMTIALTIDLWPQIPLLTADPGQGALVTVWHIARLSLLRFPDLLPPFIPFATFLGVVWSEAVFTGSRERMLIWNSGRSPLQCLTPAIIVGLVMGLSGFVLDGYLRPAAIAVQMRERFGREGLRLDRTKSDGHHWIALPGGLLRAEIEYGPPLKLHEVTLYQLDSRGHLAEVDTAVVATPLPGGRQWRLREGRYWSANLAASVGSEGSNVLTIGSADAEEAEIPFRERIVSLNLNVQWLANQGMSPQYLPMPVLRSLARADIGLHDNGSFRTRLQALYSGAVLPVLMALLAAALSLLLFAYRTPVLAVIAVLLAGYLAHFATRAFFLMGEFGYVYPVVAGWFVPLLILAMTGTVLYAIQKQRGLGTLLQDSLPFEPKDDDA